MITTLRKIREAANLTQEAVSIAADMPVNTYVRAERTGRCNRRTAARIASALGREPSEVFPNFDNLRRW